MAMETKGRDPRQGAKYPSWWKLHLATHWSQYQRCAECGLRCGWCWHKVSDTPQTSCPLSSGYTNAHQDKPRLHLLNSTPHKEILTRSQSSDIHALPPKQQRTPHPQPNNHPLSILQPSTEKPGNSIGRRSTRPGPVSSASAPDSPISRDFASASDLARPFPYELGLIA